ncbi:MAG: tRNA pseudouridine(55) synthase TruB [Agathobacter sp.]|nr:tRNA pseudouridine(55) synthase TruB [Agathobacter sp.]
MINGIINVYKEKGFTSFDVVAKMRGMFHQKKIGHTGTLDPDAEGVLPVCLGRATKVCDILTDKDKEYEAVLLLGKKTDTLDISGNMLKECDVLVSEDDIKEVIASFVGCIEQIPPMYSALKVNGQKLCDLARKGIEVERKARKIEIFSIEILDIDIPRVRFKVHCSKGTYIRTLCDDIGDKLGCCGCMEKLMRTRVSQFSLDNALKLSEIEERIENSNGADFDFIQSVDSLFEKYDEAIVSEEAEKLLYNGNRIPEDFIVNLDEISNKETVRLYDWKHSFIGLYEFKDDRKDFKPVKIFME